MSGWQVGDIALCISEKHPSFAAPSRYVRKGAPYTVTGVYPCRPGDLRALPGECVLILKECDTRHLGKGFPSSMFLKVTPPPEMIEEERKERVPA